MGLAVRDAVDENDGVELGVPVRVPVLVMLWVAVGEAVQLDVTVLV